MEYVYHRKSAEMIGEILYPLYALEEMLPAVFAKAASKYVGREHIMKLHIPVLNCRWNDVIHLSPIDPRILFSELTKAGVETDPWHMWYKIPIAKLDPEKTVILKNEKREITDDQILPFDPQSYVEMKSIGAECAEWYKEHGEKGVHPLVFARLPHVLSSIPIDIKGCEVIKWAEN